MSNNDMNSYAANLAKQIPVLIEQVENEFKQIKTKLENISPTEQLSKDEIKKLIDEQIKNGLKTINDQVSKLFLEETKKIQQMIETKLGEKEKKSPGRPPVVSKQ